jgi:hypothetical protein
MRRLAPLLALLACKSESRFRDQVRAEAYRSWVDLQICLGGKAPLPTGTLFETHMKAVELGRIVDDDWPDRCDPYQERLVIALGEANLGDAAAKAKAIDEWTAANWDPLAAAIEAARLPAVEWKQAARGVPPAPAPVDPPLDLASLKARTEPLDLKPTDPGAPPPIPGKAPDAAARLGQPMHPSCSGATTRAVIADGALHLGTAAGWTRIPFAQPVDMVKPLRCGDGTVEMVYVKEGVEHVSCSVDGCAHRLIDLGDKNPFVRDAVLSGGTIIALLRGAGGAAFVMRAQSLEELFLAQPEPVVEVDDAVIALAPLSDGALLVIVPPGEGAARYAVRVGADGKVADF